ncbi:MAG: hypothetical protein AAGB01_12530 [Cyanobacteria bacterium P01_F01_bin.42]
MPDWIFFLSSVDWTANLAVLPDGGQTFIHFAQTFEDNLGGDIGSALENFIESGQVWALGIGFVLGYIFRSFTSY